MESGSLQAVAESCLATAGSDRQPPQRRPFTARAVLAAPVPDEPAAVVTAGGSRAGRRALTAALLDTATVPDVPASSFLVIKHGPVPAVEAYLPGCRAPRPHASGPGTAAPARPPRRVEVALPDPLLRHVEFIDAPAAATLDAPGSQVLLDAVDRAGALLYLLAADRPLTPADLDLLTEVTHRRAAVFIAVTSGGGSGAVRLSGGAGSAVGDRLCGAVRAQRAALLADVPSLAGAAWFAVDPVAPAGPAGLRRALVEWAGLRGLDGVDGAPAVAGGTVRVAPGAYESDWADRLDERVRESDRRARQRLAADLADLRERCVRQIDGASGCAGLPTLLDREVHALSVRAVAGCDAAVAQILDATVAQVLVAAKGTVRDRVATAVRRGFADDPDAREMDRVLLVTTTGGVATVTGPGAVAALAAWTGPGAPAWTPPAGSAGWPAVLPPFGVGLSGGCYLHWRKPANADAVRARAWLERVVRSVELELAGELTRRLAAVRRSLATVLADAVDHGILLE